MRKWIAEEFLWLGLKMMPKGTDEKLAVLEFMIRYIKTFKTKK